MKIYKIKSGLVIESESQFFFLKNEDWDAFINDDELFKKVKSITSSARPVALGEQLTKSDLDPPVQNQEIWASGVTYYSSKLGREEESKDAGGGNFYARVYDADRPELFFKATRHRTVGSGEMVNIRKDSTWDVPEPELTLVITSNGKIVGYTIGNDMSSRSIEGENPLYLPQAKTYDSCAAVGPCIYVSDTILAEDTLIQMEIIRNGQQVFEGGIRIAQMKRDLEELVSYLFQECSFPNGCLLMTGTGVVPSKDFTLLSGDEIQITIEPIGTLINTVR